MADDWPSRDFPPMDTPMDLDRIAKAVREILEAIGEDADRDGLRDTPQRVARMYAEVCAGLHEQADTHLAVTFEAGHDEMVMVRDIAVQSLCEHHLVPFIGNAHVAYIPGPDGRITGLSKLARLVDVCAKRPGLQERMTTMIAARTTLPYLRQSRSALSRRRSSSISRKMSATRSSAPQPVRSPPGAAQNSRCPVGAQIPRENPATPQSP